MRRALRMVYWWFEKRICPRLRYSQVHYYETLNRLIAANCRWLELGCGHQMFAAWMIKEERELGSRAARLVGIDLDFDGLRKNPVISDRIFGDIERLPLADQAFDLVTANMVVEHLQNPETVLQEIRRVLRPGGIFIFHTPNRKALQIRLTAFIPKGVKNRLIGMLEGRSDEDIFKTFYKMNTSRDIAEHARKRGFEVAELRVVSTNAVTQLITPIAILELAYIRILEAPRFEKLRTNWIVVLRRPLEPAPALSHSKGIS